LALALNTDALALGICFWPGLGDMLVALALALNVLALALALYSMALLTSLAAAAAVLIGQSFYGYTHHKLQ